jgi:hypothetical protein
MRETEKEKEKEKEKVRQKERELLTKITGNAVLPN